MKSSVLQYLILGCVVFAVKANLTCDDLGDTVATDCATCTCVDDGSGTREWECQQSCEVCPDEIVSRLCILSFCIPSLRCPLYPNATCVHPECDTCDYAWYVDGQEVDCQTPSDTGCPDGETPVPCLVDPCLTATCHQHPDATCTANYCGGCHAVFTDEMGEEVECEPKEEMYRPRCPDGQELFTNCSYETVCSAGCSAFPNAICTVDHCGGCIAVYRSPLGHGLDCATGEFTSCPPGIEMMECDTDPCMGKTCSADPSAQCRAYNCGKCHFGFINSAGKKVNCETGDPYTCPPGFEVNAMSNEDACSMAVCPLFPRAMCLANPCVNPNMTLGLGCPYTFYGPRGLPVHCIPFEKPGMCPRMEGEEGEEEEEGEEGEEGKMYCSSPPMCRFDSDCAGMHTKCCGHGCNKICYTPEMPVNASAKMNKTVDKPGTCPAPSVEAGDDCPDECDPTSGDVDCPRHFKCCNSGCGNICTAPQERPDSCPMSTRADDEGSCDMECEDNKDCQRGYKCCSHGCGTKCKMPIRAEKPGTCPWPIPRMEGMDGMDGMPSLPGMGGMAGTDGMDGMPSLPGMGGMEGMEGMEGMIGMGMRCSRDDEDECTSDDDCAGREKCCTNLCGLMTCKGPEEEPGECPRLPNPWQLLSGRLRPCSGDSDCMGLASKCCSFGCKQICMEPVKKESSGLCPRPIWGNPRQTCDKVCDEDSDCPGRSKCCDNGCSCSVPEEKEGMCPSLPEDAIHSCEDDAMDMCQTDDECSGNRKCCSNGCSLVCMKANRRKPGMCPETEGNREARSGNSSCENRCYGDQDCPGISKCCESGCGWHCVNPRASEMAGSCSIPTRERAEDCVDECGPGDRCTDHGERCCYNGCGYVCLSPVPFRCPANAASERCGPETCEEATCPSQPDAVCVISTCGQCRPIFMLNDKVIRCRDQTFCSDRAGARQPSGSTDDAGDGCNKQVCNRFGTWVDVGQRKNCGVVRQIGFRIQGNFDDFRNQTDAMKGTVKRVIARRFEFNESAITDIQLRSGSIIVEAKIASEDGEVLDANLDAMKAAISAGDFSIEIGGMILEADTEYFMKEPVVATEEPATTPPPPRSDLGVYIAIGCVMGLFILVLIVSIVVCTVNSRRAKAKERQTSNVEFNEYSKDRTAFAS